MKIETKTITKITLMDLDGLDPVTVILDDVGAGRGSIIITCYGKAWTAYWGGMGKDTIAEFVCSCDEHYIANKLINC